MGSQCALLEEEQHGSDTAGRARRTGSTLGTEREAVGSPGEGAGARRASRGEYGDKGGHLTAAGTGKQGAAEKLAWT